MDVIRKKIGEFMRTRNHVCSCERIYGLPRRDAANVELSDEDLGEVQKALKEKFGGYEFKLVPVKDEPAPDTE